MPELIQPEINRTFATGSGDWTGDFVWDGGFLSPYWGNLRVTIDPSNTPQIISLNYPAISAKQGAFNSFEFSAYMIDGFNYQINITITDGNYVLEGFYQPPTPAPIWNGWTQAFDIPADWIIENTQLILTIFGITPPKENKTIALDQFSLTTEAVGKIQYLPLVGVG